MEYTSIYPDCRDEIVCQYIQEREPYIGYWERSENHALSLVDVFLRGRSNHRLLDLGCGQGRLLARFSSIFNEVVALDVEGERIEHAKRAAKTAGLKNISFVNRLFQECVGDLGKYDMVLCSHVVQHLPTRIIEKMMAGIYAVLVRNGFLVLLTSHSERAQDSFKLLCLDNSGRGVTEESVKSACAFDRIVTEDGPKNRVPVHAFAIKSVREMTSAYRVKRVHCFHALHPQNGMDAVLFRDRWINLPC